MHAALQEAERRSATIEGDDLAVNEGIIDPSPKAGQLRIGDRDLVAPAAADAHDTCIDLDERPNAVPPELVVPS
jgi:hypothetical protein